MVEVIVASIGASALVVATLGAAIISLKRTGTREHDDMAERVEQVAERIGEVADHVESGFESMHRRMDHSDVHRQAIDGRVTDVGRSVGDLREAHLRHLEHHLDSNDAPGEVDG